VPQPASVKKRAAAASAPAAEEKAEG
jgi:hypothetical protein